MYPEENKGEGKEQGHYSIMRILELARQIKHSRWPGEWDGKKMKHAHLSSFVITNITKNADFSSWMLTLEYIIYNSGSVICLIIILRNS